MQCQSYGWQRVAGGGENLATLFLTLFPSTVFRGSPWGWLGWTWPFYSCLRVYMLLEDLASTSMFFSISAFFFFKSTPNQLKKHRCLLSALSSCWKTMSGWCKSGHLSHWAHASSICLSPHKGRMGAEAFAITNPFSSNNNFVLMTAVQSNLGRAVVTADCLEEQQMLCPGLGNHESAAKGSVTSAWIHLA